MAFLPTRDRRRWRMMSDKRASVINGLSGETLSPLQQQAYGGRQTRPAFLFPLELFPAIASQSIKLGAAAELAVLPLGHNPALLLEPVQRRIERALLDRKHLVRQLLDPLRNAPAVQRLAHERFEY